MKNKEFELNTIKIEIHEKKNQTLHIRLTKKCNADCYYCSSYMEETVNMNKENLLISLNNLYDFWSQNNNIPSNLTIEYVGGEIAIYPVKELKDIVDSVRLFFKEKNINTDDGCQSNLTYSPRKIIELNKIFNKRVGTSIDNVTPSRTINVKEELYQTLFKASDEKLKEENGFYSGAVFTIDKNNFKKTTNQIKICEQENRNLTIRPIFNGGIDISSLDKDEVWFSYESSFKHWFMNSNIILEPFYGLLLSHLQYSSDGSFNQTLRHTNHCDFQHNCGLVSFCIEPNGDFYTCQELADSNFLKMGNLITNEINQELYKKIVKRSLKLSNDCYQCEYFKTCQGGCMMQAMQESNDLYGKPELCSVWKKLFGMFKESTAGKEKEVYQWLQSLN